MSTPPDKVREAFGRINEDNEYLYDWSMTPTHLQDIVKLVVPPPGVLPVIFVPGIMGTNLKSKSGQKSKAAAPVWRLDKGFMGQPTSVVSQWATKTAGRRQTVLHPDLVEVDDDGAVPTRVVGSITDISQYKSRGWGEVGQASYEEFLVWLENKLNVEQGRNNPYLWKEYTFTRFEAAGPSAGIGPAPPQKKLPSGIAMQMPSLPAGCEKGHVAPVMSDDLLRCSNFRMPVYACGYNWLASNEVGAQRLRDKIDAVIAANNRNGARCEQVILVTHSMGGLVARACQQLPGMTERIAGVVHGVMPALGAAAAYRRCKVGMWDEDWKAGLAIGNDGRKVTAVFAQAPGALQLLPNAEYRKQWLMVMDPTGKAVNVQPVSDPYDDIYLRRDRWWGLVREEWLRPKDGVPLVWGGYVENIKKAKLFHQKIRGGFHPNAYVYYGDDSDQPSFETVTWNIRSGVNVYSQQAPKGQPTPMQVGRMEFPDVFDTGNSPVYVNEKLTLEQQTGPYPRQAVNYWRVECAKQDGAGDGTVPAGSGSAPLAAGGDSIRQQFKLKGFGHEAAFRNRDAQYATLYSLMKIAGEAKIIR